MLRRLRVELTHQAEAILAAIRLSLEVAGAPIEPNDLWIAAHARYLGLILVTVNVKEFSRVEDLRVVNWL